MSTENATVKSAAKNSGKPSTKTPTAEMNTAQTQAQVAEATTTTPATNITAEALLAKRKVFAENIGTVADNLLNQFAGLVETDNAENMRYVLPATMTRNQSDELVSIIQGRGFYAKVTTTKEGRTLTFGFSAPKRPPLYGQAKLKAEARKAAREAKANGGGTTLGAEASGDAPASEAPASEAPASEAAQA